MAWWTPSPTGGLARKMPWAQIESALAPAFAHKDRKGRSVEGADMFGPTLSVAGSGVSPAGRPRLPIRPGCGPFSLWSRRIFT